MKVRQNWRQEYTEYLNTENQWFRFIPPRWKIRKLVNLIFFQEGPGLRTWQFTADGTRVICVTNITDQGIDFSRLEKFISNQEYQDSYKHFTVRKGDLLLSSSGNSWGKVATYDSNEQVILNTSTIRLNELQQGEVTKDFLKWYLQSRPCREQLEVLMTGACQPNFGPTHLKQLYIAYPDRPQQKKISGFLESRVTKLDELIRAKVDLVLRLKESQLSLITKAITKGLNSESEMKETGIHWIGNIPKHWNLKKFRHLFQIKKRISGELGHDVLSITQRGIKKKDLSTGEGQQSSDYSKYQFVKVGDFAMNHMDLLTGFVDISEYDGVTSPDYRVFSIKDNAASPRYFLYYLQMGYLNKFFFPFGQGAAHLGRWRLPTDAFKSLTAPLPPKEEQEQIVTYLDNKCRATGELMHHVETQIEALKEYRLALITDAVSGKLDLSEQRAANE